MTQIFVRPEQAIPEDIDGRPRPSFVSSARREGRVRNETVADDKADDMAALLAEHRKAIARGTRSPAGANDAGGLSQDLHDCGGYHLALLQISLKLLEAFVPEGRARAHLDRTKTQLARFAADLGSIAAAQPSAPRSRPDRAPRGDVRSGAECRDLNAFLTETLDAWSLASGLPVAFRCNRPRLRLPIALEQPLLRILQESLTNILKHARTASRVSVDLTVRRGVLTLTIGDDGCGFDPVPVRASGADDPAASGMGLPGMAARMARIGGSLVVDTGCGRGTRIQARLRLPHPV
nr:ATP-binding protein [Methylobacterium sp. OTU13CASTA1]